MTEALEQQSATAEVLRVIASSPTDVQAALQVITRSAERLCDGNGATVWRRDGDAIELITSTGINQGPPVGLRLPLDRQSVAGRSVIDGEVVHVENFSRDSEFPAMEAYRANNRVTAMIGTPLIHEGVTIGSLVVARAELAFSIRQQELLRTYADQAAIAIENARLFDELEQRNAQLQESNRLVTESLEQQTATADVLRVIASAPTELQIVIASVLEPEQE